VQELARRWQDIDVMMPEGLEELKTLCTTELRIVGKPLCHCIPPPQASVQIVFVTVHGKKYAKNQRNNVESGL
jgi:hypothetical protein